MGKIDKYLLWIMNNSSNESRKATIIMKGQFPELKRIKGVIEIETLTTTIKCTHWWLKDEENNIIDPTANHYKILNYYEEKFIKCYTCGKFCLGDHHFCSENCENLYLSKLSISLLS